MTPTTSNKPPASAVNYIVHMYDHWYFGLPVAREGPSYWLERVLLKYLSGHGTRLRRELADE